MASKNVHFIDLYAAIRSVWMLVLVSPALYCLIYTDYNCVSTITPHYRTTELLMLAGFNSIFPLRILTWKKSERKIGKILNVMPLLHSLSSKPLRKQKHVRLRWLGVAYLEMHLIWKFMWNDSSNVTEIYLGQTTAVSLWALHGTSVSSPEYQSLYVSPKLCILCPITSLVPGSPHTWTKNRIKKEGKAGKIFVTDRESLTKSYFPNSSW